MRIKDTWIVKTMDIIVDSMYECVQNIRGAFCLFVKGVVAIALIATAAIWVIPYIFLKRIVKNQKSAEAYASEGEEKC